MASQEDSDWDSSVEESTESEGEDKKKEDDDDSTKYAVAACLVAAVIILLTIGFFVFLSSSSTKSKKRRVHSNREEEGPAGFGAGNDSAGSASGVSGGTVPVDTLSTLEANDTKATTRETSSQHFETSQKTEPEKKSTEPKATEPKATEPKATEPKATAKPGTVWEPVFQVVSTTTTQPLMNKEMLLCTVRSNLVPKSPVPEDGLCDLIFYDSMIEKGSINMLDGPHTEAFDYFLEMAQKYTKTESGVGFESSEKPERSPLADIANNTGEKIRRSIFNLWSKKIYHFGILQMQIMCFSVTCLALHLRVLQTVFNILHGKRSKKRPCYTVFTNLIFQPNVDLNTLRAATNSLAGGTGDNKNSLTVPGHGMVFTSHFTLKEIEIPPNNCKIMPPHFFECPNEDKTTNNADGKPYTTFTYLWNMNTSHVALKNWVNRLFGKQAYFMSAALEGRKYQTDGLNASFLSPCSKDLQSPTRNASLTEVCDSKDYNVTSVKAWGTIARHITLKVAVTYEDAESLRFKFCSLKKKLIGVKYGIMAYSVNTDDTTNKCHKGKFQRLRTLRWLVDFFKNNFTSQSALDSCIRGQSLPQA